MGLKHSKLTVRSALCGICTLCGFLVSNCLVSKSSTIQTNFRNAFNLDNLHNSKTCTILKPAQFENLYNSHILSLTTEISARTTAVASYGRRALWRDGQQSTVIWTQNLNFSHFGRPKTHSSDPAVLALQLGHALFKHVSLWNWPLSEVFSWPHLNRSCVILHALFKIQWIWIVFFSDVFDG